LAENRAAVTIAERCERDVALVAAVQPAAVTTAVTPGEAVHGSPAGDTGGAEPSSRATRRAVEPGHASIGIKLKGADRPLS